METKILSESELDLKEGGRLLREGKTVVFPTETVYGLGANAMDEPAVKKIFIAKGRPSDNPLIVHIVDLDMLHDIVSSVSEAAQKLIDTFWPGPLTLIFPKGEKVPDAVTAGLSTVAVRCPAEETARKLIAFAGVPVAAPSANLSGKPSPTNFSHAKADMFGRVDAIIKGKSASVGVESTVLDISGDVPAVLRPGAVTVEQLRDILGEVKVAADLKSGERPKSPGMKYRHYAPKADVYILKGSLEEAADFVQNEIQKQKTGMLVFDEFAERFNAMNGLFVLSLGGQNDSSAAAHRLFAALREMDAMGVQKVYAPEIPKSGMWLAVRNRLYRAAGERILDLKQQNKESKVKNVLFVCTGNTCRSPMAEFIFRQKAIEKNISVCVSSAGIYADRAPISENAVEVLKEIGVDAEGYSSRQLTREMVEDADLVLTMTEQQRQMINMAVPKSSGKVYTLSSFVGGSEDVLDPFGGDLSVYRACRDHLMGFIERVLDKIK